MAVNQGGTGQRIVICLAGISMLVLTASTARADDTAALPFEEEYVCGNERSSANFAAANVTPAPDEATALARVEKECRDLARATEGRRGQEACKRWRAEAVAGIEYMRAARKASIARRDASAKELAECVEREKRAYLTRAAAEAAERQRKADEAAAERERIEKLMSSKPTVRLALSALVCLTDNDRADALRAIADEKKYARIGGVQNNTRLYELQKEVRDSDQRKAEFSRELKIRKTSAIKCSDPKVKQIATCIRRTPDDGPCLVDEVAGPVEVVRMIELGDLVP